MLILTVGLPRSGKSTWARLQGHPIVCPDAIRLALHGQRFVKEAEGMVWATAHLMVRSLFRAGHKDVILDACSVTRARRDEWLPEDPEFRIHLVETPPAVCMARAAAEGRGSDLIPIIKKMARDWDLPRGDGWVS